MEVVPSTEYEEGADAVFNIPLDIKNDLVYCQRAIKGHLRVIQMVVDVYQKQPDANPYHKLKIISEVEAEIYEINAEQTCLTIHLRRIVDKFFGSEEDQETQPGYQFVYETISEEINSLVEDYSVLILPKLVAVRNTEDQLINKYFEARQVNECFEVLDSDEEASLQAQQMNPASAVAEVDLTIEYPQTERNGKQLSLLKPLDQRGADNIDESVFNALPKNEKCSRNTSPLSSISDAKSSVESLSNGSSENNFKVTTAPVTDISMSRMNLRQALKRARTENLAALQRAPKDTTTSAVAPATSAAKAAGAVVKQSSKKLATASSSNSSTTINSAITSKKNESRKSARVATSTSTKVTDIQTSSDDSNLERDRTPPKSSLFDEPKQTETMPEDVGQETFLKMFGLFTFEYRAQMQQRRSKRKRRCVQNNERSDFLYGRFEVNNTSVEEKKKKERKIASWLSPQPKKRAKRRSADKHDDINSSRSNSSSPNDKRACNECLKGGGLLDQCGECQLFYHDSCHHEDDVEKILPDKDSYETDNIKRCPRCKRAMSDEVEKGVKFVNLRQKFELKAEQELNRRDSLEKGFQH